MARQCEICGKGKQMGNHRKLLRGHYNVTGRRTFKPNLQKAIIAGTRVLACVACIRTSTKSARLSAK
jgi:ribosomal protein L28